VTHDAREDAFRRLYQTYFSPIAAYTRRRLDRPDADDAVADIFLVAWRRLEDIPSGDLALAWLYSVARRVVSQGNRTSRRRHRLLARLTMLKRPDEAELPEGESLGEREVVHLALGRLPPNDQELLRLAEWEGLSAAELALVLGCSTNAVAIRLHRAHRRFRDALDAVEREAEIGAQREVAT
jgi:RNA polymerase sigma-70 factor, ECF subfamily